MSIPGLAINFIRGFCMALADSVPGVSGGTIAFLLGFYDRFIVSLDDLFHGTRETRLSAVKFLLKIGVGWLVGFALAAVALSSLFETHIYAVSSVFLGFVVLAIPFVLLEEHDLMGQRPPWILFIFLAIGVAVVVAITLLNPVSGEGIDVSLGGLSPLLVVYVFVAGAVAISAMVLPGISGSTLMLIFGLYIPIMGAVRSVLALDLSYAPVLIVFLLGVCCGLLLFVRILRVCLERYRPQVVCLIIGMMIGSLFAITQGPLTLDDPLPAMGLDTFSLGFFVLGGLVVAALQGIRGALRDPDEA